MAGIEEAAQSFQREIAPPTRPERGSSETDGAESVFNPRIDESEEEGGADDSVEFRTRDGKEVKITKSKAKEEAGDEDSGDPEYPDLGEEDESAPDGEKGEDEGEEGVDAKPQEDKEEGELDLSKKVKVTIDGKEEEVPLREAINGYIRMETFHQRLNQINEAKQTVQNEAAQVNQAREVYINMLANLKEQLDSLSPAEPNWVEEYKRDPVAAANAQQQWEAYKKQRAGLDEQRNKVLQEKQQEETRAHNAWVQEQVRNAFVLIPEWNDKRKLGIDKTRIHKTAKAAGFSDQEIAGVIDARQLVVLRKAALYDALMAQTVKGKTAGNQVRRQGSGTSRTAPKQASNAAARLNRTGSVHDAARLFEMELAQEG